jgi:uncharacterized protein YggT (Ycf19 family)
MDETDKLAADEARRLAQHESIKGQIREKVHAEISDKANRATPTERASEDALANSLKRKAVHEVAAAEFELDRGHAFARVSQVVDYVFYLTYGVIALEIVLEALGARESAGFKQFVDAVAAPVLSPFRGLMPDPGVGPFRFMVSYVIALGVYILLHMAVNGLLRMFVHRKTVV